MITVVGEDRSAHRGIQAVSPAVQVAPAKWRIGDEQVAGDDIAVGSLAIGPGFVGSLDLTLVSPPGSSGASSIKMFRRYLDRVGNELDEYVSGSIAVDAVEGAHTLTLPSAPADTEVVEWGLRSDMAPVGAPARANLWTDPRCTALGMVLSHYGWAMTAVAAESDIGLAAGLRTYIQATAPTVTATMRGIDFGADNVATVPAAAQGVPVVPGETYTVSAYMQCNRAVTFQSFVRAFAGTAWSAATVNGGTVAAAANTWVRVSQTYTIPAGAAFLSFSIRVPASTAWTAGDYIRTSQVLVEKAGAAGTYFDGTTNNGIPAPSSVRWEGAANASRSLLYASALAGGPTIEATASKLTYSAEAEELIGATLERDLRRSVADVWSSPGALITAGQPGLLAGTLTYLCATLAQARGVESVYRMGGLVTLHSDSPDDELDGLTHRAVERTRFAPQMRPGRAARWTLAVDVREQV